MLILMGAYGEGHIIGTQIALAAALAAAPDFECMCCVDCHSGWVRPCRQWMARVAGLRVAVVVRAADLRGIKRNDVVSVALNASGAGMVRTERTDRDNVAVRVR